MLEQLKKLGEEDGIGDLKSLFEGRIKKDHSMAVFNLLNKISNDKNIKVNINIYAQDPKKGVPTIDPKYIETLKPIKISDFHEDIREYIYIEDLNKESKKEITINIIQYDLPKHFEFIIKYEESSKNYLDRLNIYKKEIQERLKDIEDKGCGDTNLNLLSNYAMKTYLGSINEAYNDFKKLKGRYKITSEINDTSKVDGALNNNSGESPESLYTRYDSQGNIEQSDSPSDLYQERHKYIENNDRYINYKEYLVRCGKNIKN